MPKTPATPVRVNVDNLTLDQLDEVQKIVEHDKAGRLAAIAFVSLRGTDTRFSTLKKCKELTLRDVNIVDDEDEHPTNGQP